MPRALAARAVDIDRSTAALNALRSHCVELRSAKPGSVGRAVGRPSWRDVFTRSSSGVDSRKLLHFVGYIYITS